MKGIVKGLIIGFIIIAIGAAILIGTLAYNGWTVKSPKFETRSYAATDDDTVIKINVGAGSVITERYDGDKIYIEYPYAENFTFEIDESNGVLAIKSNKVKLLWGWQKIPETVIKLPNGVIYDIELDMDAGTATLADGTYKNISVDIDAGTFKAGDVVCDKLECDMSAGSVKINGAVCNVAQIDISAGSLNINKLDCGNSDIEVSAGSAKIAYTGAIEEYSISAKKSAGSCNVTSRTGTTDKNIKVEVSAGSVNLSFEN